MKDVTLNESYLKRVNIKDIIEKERSKSEAFRQEYDARREATNVARQLYDLREKRGLTQAELARKIGTSQQAISRLENPNYKSHTIAFLQKVVEALGGKIKITIEDG